jgi:bifunctional polynucleotide phosphatase/kinase
MENSSYFQGNTLNIPDAWRWREKIFSENEDFKTKTSEDILPYQNNSNILMITPSKEQEIVIMVGYPGAGKSSIAHGIFGAAGYEVLEGDQLKTSERIINTVKSILKYNLSVVIDSTNLTKNKRAEYINFATERNIPIRCIYVATSLEESMARNIKRLPYKIVSKNEYTLCKARFVEPTTDEGCEVIKIE